MNHDALQTVGILLTSVTTIVIALIRYREITMLTARKVKADADDEGDGNE